MATTLLTKRLLSAGVSVILDWGFWTRAEREHYRHRGRELGATVETVFLDLPMETLHQRVRERNSNLSAGMFMISVDELNTWAKLFEPPTPEEMAGS